MLSVVSMPQTSCNIQIINWHWMQDSIICNRRLCSNNSNKLRIENFKYSQTSQTSQNKEILDLQMKMQLVESIEIDL